MRLVFVTPTLNFGGYEKVIINYSNHFVTKGHDVTIICGYTNKETEKIIDKRVKIIQFEVRLRNFLIPLINFLNSEIIDILYVPYRTYTSLAVIARMLSKNKNVVIYGSAHGYGKENCFVEYLEGIIMKNADILTATTKQLAKYESNALHIPFNKYVVLNNPVIDTNVPISLEKHKWLGKNKKCPVICMSGRLSQDKHIEIALHIVEKLNEFIKVKLLVLGNGPELEYLKTLCKRLKIDNVVDFVGYVENPMGYMIQTDVFLHTSFMEGFGNVIVEALYCNLPVVTSDNGGPIEIIKNDQYGINIGKIENENIIDNGIDALKKILTKQIVFNGLRERALEFSINSSDKYFFRPYYNLKGLDYEK